MGGRLELPPNFRSVRYSGLRYPGAANGDGLEAGANCQRFAYALLAHFGLNVPDVRSSRLWDDTRFTEYVSAFRPLDLLLWNRTSDAYGAHVGVYLGEGRAAHLSKRVGVPAVWSLPEFGRYPEYRALLGAKRVRGGSA